MNIIDGKEAIDAHQAMLNETAAAEAGGRSFDLMVPVEHEGALLKRITLRPLKVKDMVAVQRMGGDPVDMTFNLFALSAGLPRSVIDELSIPDAEVLLPEVDAISGKSTRVSAKDSS